MQLPKVSHIDEEKCTGCGLCTQACHQGALQLVNGKARLTSASQCDGLGICLPVCPNGAITLEEHHNHTPVSVNRPLVSGCPGNDSLLITRPVIALSLSDECVAPVSQLRQWPCQIQLAPASAPFFSNASLLIAADCTAYAYANIHQDFMGGKVTLIGCPKLDNYTYTSKLKDIFQQNNISTVTVLRMEKPCCAGLANAAGEALRNSGKSIPLDVVVIGIDGSIVKDPGSLPF